jgi:hypothetical protein
MAKFPQRKPPLVGRCGHPALCNELLDLAISASAGGVGEEAESGGRGAIP